MRKWMKRCRFSTWKIIGMVWVIAFFSPVCVWNVNGGMKTDTEEKPKIALTFDDGPCTSCTRLLLEGLKDRGVQATFFLIGENIEGKEALVRQMSEEGHLIGNHTYSHANLKQIPKEQAKLEILRTNNLIYEITGIYPEFIRPPYGAWPKNLDLYVEMLPVLWNIDTLDWKSQNVSEIIKAVKGRIKDGSVILMHDIYPTSVEATLKLVDLLLEENYEFVTIDQLLCVQ